jgi:hypothetical protein
MTVSAFSTVAWRRNKIRHWDSRALFGILWGSFSSCAPISSALFEAR